MRERHNRLAVVKELIKNNRIDNQDTLLEMLKTEGYTVTQATLSRDLKMLKVGKISDGWSGYYYSLPENDLISESEKSYIQDVRRGILSIEFSGNFGVIKTRQGKMRAMPIRSVLPWMCWQSLRFLELWLEMTLSLSSSAKG